MGWGGGIGNHQSIIKKLSDQDEQKIVRVVICQYLSLRILLGL